MTQTEQLLKNLRRDISQLETRLDDEQLHAVRDFMARGAYWMDHTHPEVREAEDTMYAATAEDHDVGFYYAARRQLLALMLTKHAPGKYPPDDEAVRRMRKVMDGRGGFMAWWRRFFRRD